MAQSVLFQVAVANSNALPVPFAIAKDYISPVKEQMLKITDPNNHTWEMSCFRFDEEGAFIVLKNWYEYAAQYNLVPGDLVHFMIPETRLGANHFQIKHFNSSGVEK